MGHESFSSSTYPHTCIKKGGYSVKSNTQNLVLYHLVWKPWKRIEHALLWQRGWELFSFAFLLLHVSASSLLLPFFKKFFFARESLHPSSSPCSVSVSPSAAERRYIPSPLDVFGWLLHQGTPQGGLKEWVRKERGRRNTWCGGTNRVFLVPAWAKNTLQRNYRVQGDCETNNQKKTRPNKQENKQHNSGSENCQHCSSFLKWDCFVYLYCFYACVHGSTTLRKHVSAGWRWKTLNKSSLLRPTWKTNPPLSFHLAINHVPRFDFPFHLFCT